MYKNNTYINTFECKLRCMTGRLSLSLMKPIYMKYNHQYLKANIISTNKELSISTCKIPIRFQTYDCDKPTVIEVAYLCN